MSWAPAGARAWAETVIRPFSPYAGERNAPMLQEAQTSAGRGGVALPSHSNGRRIRSRQFLMGTMATVVT